MPGERPDCDAAHTPVPARQDNESRHASQCAPQERRRKATRGQALVELAFIVPLLVLMLAVAADFGRAFTAFITVSSAAREGASFGMMSSANSTNENGIRAAALADAPTIWGVAPEVNPSTATDPQGYTMVIVTVNYTFTPLMSIPPIPSSIAMSRTVQMRVLN